MVDSSLIFKNTSLPVLSPLVHVGVRVTYVKPKVEGCFLLLQVDTFLNIKMMKIMLNCISVHEITLHVSGEISFIF